MFNCSVFNCSVFDVKMFNVLCLCDGGELNCSMINCSEFDDKLLDVITASISIYWKNPEPRTPNKFLQQISRLLH